MIDQLTTLWTSAALPCLIVFVCCLSLEWYLRRRWDCEWWDDWLGCLHLYPAPHSSISFMLICLFDIDGTLLSSGGAGKAALETALTEDFATPLRAEIPYAGRTDRSIVRDLLQVHDIADTPANFQKIFAGYLRRLPEFLRAYRGRVLPGISELLHTLRQRTDVVVGLLTGNIRAGAQVKLGHFGLFEHFVLGGFGDLHFDRDDVAEGSACGSSTPCRGARRSGVDLGHRRHAAGRALCAGDRRSGRGSCHGPSFARRSRRHRGRRSVAQSGRSKRIASAVGTSVGWIRPA